MEILQVIEYFAPQFGGPVNSTYNLSAQLTKRGHDVTIITTDLGLNVKYIGSMQGTGVDVVYFPCKLNLLSFLYSPSMKRWLKENIQNFDVIHMHNFRSYQNYVVSCWAKTTKTPYILQAHGSVLPFFEKESLKKVFDFFMGYKILNNSEMVFALNKYESRQYEIMGVPPEKIKIIPNGIDPNIYKTLNVLKKEFRTKYLISNDEKIILYLGRMHKIKGIDLLIKSFKLLSDDIDNVKLVLVGPGDTSHFKKLIQTLSIENKVIFTGPLYGEEKFKAFIDSDIYVLPSVYEAFPNTVLEALLFRKPVIVTEGCGIKDIIHEKTGYAVKRDKYSLKEAMCSILSNEDLRHYFMENAELIINNEFNWIKIVDKIEFLYEKTIGD